MSINPVFELISGTILVGSNVHLKYFFTEFRKYIAAQLWKIISTVSKEILSLRAFRNGTDFSEPVFLRHVEVSTLWITYAYGFYHI